MALWSHVASLVLLAAGAQAFAPAPIRWGGVANSDFFLVSGPRTFSDMRAVQPPHLKIAAFSDKMSLDMVPYFTAKPDNTIFWEASGLCIEASGTQNGDAVRLNSCDGGYSQKWDWLPRGLIQLRGTNQCLGVTAAERDLNGAPVQLTECKDEITELWQFEAPSLAQEASPNTRFSSSTRHMLISCASMAMVGFLASLLWRWQGKKHFAVNAVTSSRSVGKDGGISLIAPPAGVVNRSGDVKMAVDDKAEVKEYFNNDGFDRWNRIYSEDGEVNAVQLDIREGHAVTVDKVLGWIDEDGTAKAGEKFCDAGCGVGSLSLPLAKRGAVVSGSDISAAMVAEATKRAAEAELGDNVSFVASDLESLEGKYDTVTCIDVLIHYPEDKMAGMVKHLASLADSRLIISFAPNTWYYTALKKFGELFPGPSKATRAYLHKNESVVAALEDAGFKIERTEMTGTKFYFSRLLEAKRA